jgi:hypothetical protein
MSKFKKGEMDGDWEIIDRIDRGGSLELKRNVKTGYWGVYLYEHASDEYWILHSSKATEENARYIFEIASQFLD